MSKWKWMIAMQIFSAVIAFITSEAQTRRIMKRLS